MDSIISKIDTLSLTDTITMVKDTIQTKKTLIEQIQVSSSSSNFELIGVISGAVAALAALTAIFLTYRSNKLDRESRRPYFTLSSPGFKKISNNLRLQITFENNGTHPAKKFKGEIRIFQDNLENEVKIDIDIVNDIPANSPTPYYNDSVALGNNMPKHFIFCKISYLDPILRKEYNQEFFMKWHGVKNGTTHPDFVQIDTNEKKIVEEYIKNNA